MGSRVLVRVLSHEFKSAEGIIVPSMIIPAAGGDGASSDPHGLGGPGTATIKVVEILDVGEGKLNTTTGQYMGSRWEKGQKALMRHGISAVAHIDYLPGRQNEAMVQEDTLVARVEFDVDERDVQPAQAKKPVLVK